MGETSKVRSPVTRIEVRIQVASDRMAATDDPVYLGVRGPGGREFRLSPAHGHAFRRGELQHFVLAGPDDGATNIEHPELNDPRQPAFDAEGITAMFLRKGMMPIPNVRGLGEMDDRLEVEWVEVEVTAEGRAAPLRFARKGALWMGLVCGHLIEIPRIDA